jgi:hypothetical protein
MSCNWPGFLSRGDHVDSGVAAPLDTQTVEFLRILDATCAERGHSRQIPASSAQPDLAAPLLTQKASRTCRFTWGFPRIHAAGSICLRRGRLRAEPPRKFNRESIDSAGQVFAVIATCVAPTRPVIRVAAIRQLDGPRTMPPNSLIPALALLLVAREATGNLTSRGRRPWLWIIDSARRVIRATPRSWAVRSARSEPCSVQAGGLRSTNGELDGARHRLGLTGTAKGASAPFRKWEMAWRSFSWTCLTSI